MAEFPDLGANYTVYDLNGTPDIKVEKVKTKLPEEFEVTIKGKNVHTSLSNAIRRTILMHIPIYGYHRSNIFIEHKKCKYMYNNDLIYNQIETLPIYDVPNDFDLEEMMLFMPHEALTKIFGDSIKQADFTQPGSKIHDIEFMLSVKNMTDDFKFVSTHDAVFKIDGKERDNYKKHPAVSIIVLKPGEEVHLRAVANISIAHISAIYDATTTAIHKMITPTEFRLSYETLGQLDKNVIFEKACLILSKKLEYLEKFVNDTFKDDPEYQKNQISIELYGETYTLGNLISNILQCSDYVEKAGYAVPHPFMPHVIIEFKIYDDSKLSAIEVLVKAIKYGKKMFDVILKQWK